MRYIKTTNGLVEFIESEDNGGVISSRGFQFGELYFQIKNDKVTFYLTDSETPYRNDIWTVNLPLTIDDVVYATADVASQALGKIMNDSLQAQIDILDSDLADEIARSTSEDSAHTANIQSLSATVSTLTNNLNNEVSRSTSVDAAHNANIQSLSGSVSSLSNSLTALSNSLAAEVARATQAESAITADIADIQAKDGQQDERLAVIETSLSGKTDKANAIASAEYVSESHQLKFYNFSGGVLSIVDATPFIKDGMLSDVTISGSNIVFTFNTDAGKQPISIPITDIFDPSLYYTKTEVDEKDNILSGAISSNTADIQTISGDVATVSGNVNTLSAKTDALEYSIVNGYDAESNDLQLRSEMHENNDVIARALIDLHSSMIPQSTVDAISGDVQSVSGAVATLSAKADALEYSITNGYDAEANDLQLRSELNESLSVIARALIDLNARLFELEH